MLPHRARVNLEAMAMKGMLRIPQSPSITWTLPSDYLVSYPGHLLGGSLTPSAEVQSVYSTAPANWARRSKDKLLRDFLLWTPTHVHASIFRPARTYLYQLCANTACSLENLPGVMDNRHGWRDRESGKIRASRAMMMKYRINYPWQIQSEHTNICIFLENIQIFSRGK